MEIFTIGLTKRSADDFFGTLRRAGIKRVLDVRLNNSSQLAGFSKRDDLEFFLRELCVAEYVHEPLLAPTQQMLDHYKKNGGTWHEYEQQFLSLMRERCIEDRIDRRTFDGPTVVLCSEPIPECCHRRLVLEYLQDQWGGFHIVHL
jgi:uncharacterized protein (DUF488 family)